jgi:hypothetical protein
MTILQSACLDMAAARQHRAAASKPAARDATVRASASDRM